ncbi:hypothetical protein Cfor_06952 [Coptotermes formosanus]|uniref:Uncharacterized protein n=1 Tax=Coptotermes formosanus TaxID=36987 RepID=A0A6L2PM45_COPFO|nr:hypothetical protein Cfor_06952 [Coptotermes formosanus]
MGRAFSPYRAVKFLPEEPEDTSLSEDLQTKIAKAYEKMKEKINTRNKKKRKDNRHWKPKLNDKALLRAQPVPDATAGVTAKFLRPYEGTYVVTKVTPRSTFELSEENGHFRGKFNKKLLKEHKKAARGDEITN